jgi:hypothetical protein
LRAHIDADKTVVFEVYLPSIEVTAASVPIEAENQKVLLLIEQNSEVRRLLHCYFEQHGYNVLEANGCEEALRLAESFERPIQLVIANPAVDDKYRTELRARLVVLKPGICVRQMEGYREEAEKTARYLTMRELLEWANHALEPASRLAVAN